MNFRMVIEAFVYLQRRLKEEDQKFDGPNILKRKGMAPRISLQCFETGQIKFWISWALNEVEPIHINPSQLSPLPTIKKIQISVPMDPQNPEEAKKIVQRAINQDRLSGRNVFAGKGPIYVQTTTGLQGLNGIKKITGTSGNVIIREQTGIRLVLIGALWLEVIAIFWLADHDIQWLLRTRLKKSEFKSAGKDFCNWIRKNSQPATKEYPRRWFICNIRSPRNHNRAFILNGKLYRVV